jgi:predicted nucleic-acid-binding Zn-ribbon protein
MIIGVGVICPKCGLSTLYLNQFLLCEACIDETKTTCPNGHGPADWFTYNSNGKMTVACNKCGGDYVAEKDVRATRFRPPGTHMVIK